MYKCIDCINGDETQHSSSGSALLWALEHLKRYVDEVGVIELTPGTYHVYSMMSDEIYFKILNSLPYKENA